MAINVTGVTNYKLQLQVTSYIYNYNYNYNYNYEPSIVQEYRQEKKNFQRYSNKRGTISNILTGGITKIALMLSTVHCDVTIAPTTVKHISRRKKFQYSEYSFGTTVPLISEEIILLELVQLIQLGRLGCELPERVNRAMIKTTVFFIFLCYTTNRCNILTRGPNHLK